MERIFKSFIITALSIVLLSLPLVVVAAEGDVVEAFGADGFFEFNVSDFLGYEESSVSSKAIAVDSRQRVFTIGFNHSLDFFAVMCVTESGELCDDFGTGGIASLSDFNDNGYYDSILEMKKIRVDQDDNIYLVGTADVFDVISLVVHKFDSNGDIVTDFGEEGMAYLDASELYYSYGNDIFIANDGNLYVVGDVYSGDIYMDEAIVAKFSENGDLVGSFGLNGYVKTDTSVVSDDTKGFGVVVQDDIIYVSGTMYARDIGTYGAFIASFDTDGNENTDFGEEGYNFTNQIFSSNSYFSGQLSLHDDKLIIGGNIKYSSYYQAMIMRFDLQGELDDSFDEDGYMTASFGDEGDALDTWVDAIVNQDGDIFLVGQASYSGGLAVLKVSSDGSIDSDYGDNGIAKIGDNWYSSFPYGIAMDPCNSDIVITGLVYEEDIADAARVYEFNVSRFEGSGDETSGCNVTSGDDSSFASDDATADGDDDDDDDDDSSASVSASNSSSGGGCSFTAGSQSNFGLMGSVIAMLLFIGLIRFSHQCKK
jgi:uncharacterized delta-60 repeat protein